MAQPCSTALPPDLLHSLRDTPILQLRDGKRHRVTLSTAHSNLMAEVQLAWTVRMTSNP